MMVGKKLIQDHHFMDRLRSAKDGDVFVLYANGNAITLRVEVNEGYRGHKIDNISLNKSSWVEKYFTEIERDEKKVFEKLYLGEWKRLNDKAEDEL